LLLDTSTYVITSIPLEVSVILTITTSSADNGVHVLCLLLMDIPTHD
jgi:hypothetical protein